MLTELCLYLKNWFNAGIPWIVGKFTINGGVLYYKDEEINVQQDQYYRICGSIFNDGVHQHGSESLKDEAFNGAIWPMAVPADVIALCGEIEAWQAQYGAVTSENMSPFNSESFAGYSYSKSGGGSSSSSSSVGTWQGVFADRLGRYKKL